MLHLTEHTNSLYVIHFKNNIIIYIKYEYQISVVNNYIFDLADWEKTLGMNSK